MGPFQRQALRVLSAGSKLGFDYMTAGLIAQVLQECGVECRPSQITAALSGITSLKRDRLVTRHYRTQVRKSRPHDPINPGYYMQDKTFGWSINETGERALRIYTMDHISHSRGFVYRKANQS